MKFLEHIDDFWKTLFPPPDIGIRIDPRDPRQTGVLPQTHAKCCAQFAVTRDAVLGLSLDAWERIRAPLVRDLKEYSWGRNQNAESVGLLYEPLWHLLFGQDSV